MSFGSVDRVESLVPGRYGVREPPADAPVETLGPDVLVLVPGVAFDACGGRLGRGAGLWDRALADARGAVIFGVGYELQIMDRVPCEAHDRPIDALLTEARNPEVRPIVTAVGSEVERQLERIREGADVFVGEDRAAANGWPGRSLEAARSA